jgi:NAD(P)-dependent dehydrogenase (short-subunit alcohol dehydrogenase family)
MGGKMVNFSLTGKVAMVTGGSRGIGKAIALAYAEAGADVAICARNLTELETVADEIKAKGKKGLAISYRIGEIEDSKNLVKTVVAQLGHIDILVNNAGMMPPPGLLIDAEESVWDDTLKVNLKRPFIMGQLVARIIRDQGSGGSIINVASAGGFKPRTAHIYSVSKAGLIMLTKSMAKEWGQYNIRVNALAPGVVETRLVETLLHDQAARESPAATNLLSRIAQPEDVAGAAVYLASDAARHVTGATILIDGGELLM